MHLVQSYDTLHGHPTPPLQSWTDAFSDVLGKNSHCPMHWSPLDNAFTHHWGNTNVYAFPPMHDDAILKTLQYHSSQQQVMKRKGTSFKGVYLVPYKPTALYWKYTYDFQILKIYTTRDTILQAPSNRGKTQKGMNDVPSTVPMCVLYDPGYTEPDTMMSFMNAMEACAIAYDTLALKEIPALESFMDINDGRVGQESPTNSLQEPTNLNHPTFCATPMKPKPTDIPKPDSNPTDQTFWSGIETLRLYNMTHCQKPPTYIDQQPIHSPTLQDKVIASMQSAGNLATILELNDPDWEQVDKAIHEHIRVLTDQHDHEEDTSDYDPQMFHKTWLEGGYLPLNYVRSIEDPIQDSQCLVIKTKVLGSINNTSLIDEGATRSVLNVDWYENQGIDWKKEFGVQEANLSTVYMANQTPTPSYGITTLPIEIQGDKKVTFTQEFQLLRLGKSNYAQILGFDWKLKHHTATYLPEYTIDLRKIGCVINAHPMPIRLYQLHTPNTSTTCETVSPHQLI